MLRSEVKVQLVGMDSNVFAIIGRVSQALKRAGFHNDAAEFIGKAMASHSYGEVLGLCMEYVDVH